MKVIVGLGNPGSSYAMTRHNAGFLTLDVIAGALNADISRKEHDALTTLCSFKGEKILLVKPQSYMNLSGFPLVRVLNYYKVDLEDVLVIFDDMSLTVGTFRLRSRGSSGGHKGMESIILQTGTDNISRLKVGIGASVYNDAKDYVLGHFSEEEMPEMTKVFALAKDVALFWAANGITKAMNEYNIKKTVKEAEKRAQDQQDSDKE